ncbi:MAG TPA: hypothetical protein DCR14_06195 [Acidimicrobiaceae bacterium]|nr:hypothetical protein [Acidimicrobiaceae bacterium]
MSRRRVPYFERPKQPHDWRWVVGGIGKALITLGLLMFGFVGYQLWGTGLETARAQNSLDDEWAEKLASTTSSTLPASTTTVATTVQPGDTTTSTTSTLPVAPNEPPPTRGEGIFKLRIPKIDIDYMVVSGVRVDDLKKGPGHFRESVMPGQLGNSAVAGHRTTYGAPFFDLDQLEPGDLITVETLTGTYVYEVTGSEIVSPADYAKVVPTVDPTVATLTLATCHPAYTARERLIVYSRLVPEQSGQVFQPPSVTAPAFPTDDTVPEELPGETVPGDTVPGDSVPQETAPVDTVPADDAGGDSEEIVDESFDDTFTQGWFDDTAAIPHVLGWALVLVLICVGSYFIGRAARRLWVTFAVAFLPFIVCLYFFYENVHRLLPPGI